MAAVLPLLGVVVQSDTDGAAVVAIVLADNLLAVQLPEPRVVVAAGSDQIGTICAECTVPYPSLVSRQGGLEWERPGFRLRAGGLHLLDLPDLGGVVGAASSQLLDIGRE